MHGDASVITELSLTGGADVNIVFAGHNARDGYIQYFDDGH